MYQVCEMDCGGIWAFIVSCLLHSFLSFLLFSSSPLVWSGVGSIPIANKMPAYSVNVPKTNKIHANIHASIAVSPMFKGKFCQFKPCYSVHNITVFYSCYAFIWVILLPIWIFKFECQNKWKFISTSNYRNRRNL